jgi:hypothetical protein
MDLCKPWTKAKLDAFLDGVAKLMERDPGWRRDCENLADILGDVAITVSELERHRRKECE